MKIVGGSCFLPMLLARGRPHKLSASNHSKANPLLMTKREVQRRLIRGSPLIGRRYLKSYSVISSDAVQNALLTTESTDIKVEVCILCNGGKPTFHSIVGFSLLIFSSLFIFLHFRHCAETLSIIVSRLKNQCELIAPCSPDMSVYFNIQVTRLSRGPLALFLHCLSCA